MFLWLLVQHQDSEILGKSKLSKLSWSFILSYVHNLAYINVEQNTDTRLKIAIFYAVTLVENILLVTLWTTSISASIDYSSQEKRDIVMTVVLAFMGGLFFMLLYYRLFHTSKISNAFNKDSGENSAGIGNAGFSAENSGFKNGAKNGTRNPEKVAMAEYVNNQAVFNCVLNPALRKKKKIPSVLPPPPSTITTQGIF